MKTFEYSRPKSIQEAISLKNGSPDARFLAGGTNLIDLMKYNVEEAATLIDVTHLPISKVEDTKTGGLMVGALVRNSDLAKDPRVLRRYPVLSQAILNGASPQLRNMATTAGNLLQRTRCYYFYDTAFPCNKRQPGSGCPAIAGYNRIHAILGQSDQCIAVHPSDMCVALAALDSVIHVQGKNGSRTIPMLDFHRLPENSPNIDTNLQSDELITAVELLPLPVARNSSYLKVRDRSSYAFALVSVGAALEVNKGQVTNARIALGGVAHKPWRAQDAEKSLIGQPANEDSFKQAAELALNGAKGYEHNQFKIELAKRAIVRTLSDMASGGNS